MNTSYISDRVASVFSPQCTVPPFIASGPLHTYLVLSAGAVPPLEPPAKLYLLFKIQLGGLLLCSSLSSANMPTSS